MLDFALYYVNEGLRVLPLHSARSTDCCTCGQANCSSVAKHPITRNGVKDASCDPVQTGSGGLHLYFQYDKQLALRNTAGKLAPGIDTRASGGYVVAAPSRHAGGNRYYWKDRRPGYVQAPDALLELLAGKAVRQLVSSPTPTPASATCDTTQQTPRNLLVPEGKRNTTLVSLAGSLRNLGANEEALFIVLQAMNKACCRPLLSAEEVRQICVSAVKWEPGATSERLSGLDGLKDALTLLQQELPEPQWAVPVT
jgi:Bifunctional DNA primase/polymerase, N-terminal/Primase C terminal 1 (PriCT-1)